MGAIHVCYTGWINVSQSVSNVHLGIGSVGDIYCSHFNLKCQQKFTQKSLLVSAGQAKDLSER
jgi:hypothetical protein